ncbi:chlorohydrolase [Streptococcus pneumoniae]|nr:chlorohydrolase [Streptococcus pneumoniae]
MTQYPFFILKILYSIKIKEKTRKLAADCSKHCFEVIDETHCFEVVDRTDRVSIIYLRQGEADVV